MGLPESISSADSAGRISVSLVPLLVSGRASTLGGILLGFWAMGDDEEEEDGEEGLRGGVMVSGMFLFFMFLFGIH